MGCTVDTLTLSIEQKELAEVRIREAGVEDRVTVHLMDYRNMPPTFKNAFDGCVSFEMIEVSCHFCVRVVFVSSFIVLS